MVSTKHMHLEDMKSLFDSVGCKDSVYVLSSTGASTGASRNCDIGCEGCNIFPDGDIVEAIPTLVGVCSEAISRLLSSKDSNLQTTLDIASLQTSLRRQSTLLVRVMLSALITF